MVEKKFLWITVTFFLCIVVFEVSAQQFYPMRYGKRDDSGAGGMQRFHTGSRYGRSQGKVEVAARNDRFFFGSRYGKRGVNSQGSRSTSSAETNSRYGRSSSTGQVEVASRNDRFFLGTRYGKRDESDLNTVASQDESVVSNTMPKIIEDNVKHVKCIYTGFDGIYRCMITEYETSEESTNPF